MIEKLVPGLREASMAKGFMTSYLGKAAMGTGFGLAAATAGVLFGGFGLEHSANMAGGTGDVQIVYFTLPSVCHVAYDSEIKADATYSTTVKIPLLPWQPTLQSDTEEYKGIISSQVCTNPDTYTYDIDYKKHKATLTLKPDSFTSIVYPKKLVNTDFHTVHNSIITAIQKNLETDLKVAPNLNFTGSREGTVDKVRGLAFLAAQSGQAKECGPAAYDAIKLLVVEALKQDSIKSADLQLAITGAGQPKFAASDINVVMPPASEVQFTTQYDDELKKVTDSLGKDVKVTPPSDFKCKAGSGVLANAQTQLTSEIGAG